MYTIWLNEVGSLWVLGEIQKVFYDVYYDNEFLSYNYLTDWYKI